MSLTATKTLQKQKGINGTLLSFLLGMLGALAIFLPFLIVDKGFFLYCGDYNSQQIPFYMYVQQFIKSGGGTWSWATDLGSSAVNSYSFYNIGSPFLWFSLVFPNSWMPFLMVPLFMVKFGAIAACAHLFLSRYSKSQNMAVVCSIIYAFCGFNVYNIFFNHMLDPVSIFALMLWAMDGFVYDKKRGFFAVSVGLALLNSYFFFLGNVTFLVIYFFVKVLTNEYRLDVKDFGLLVLEAVLGVALGMVLALPAFFNMIGNPRTDNFANGFGMIMYGNVQQYFAILSSLIMPPDPPYLPNVFKEGAIKWTSMSAFLPVVSIAGVAAYCKSRKGTAIKWLLGISLVMALVPFLNSSFYAFNASYYARWYYMPILILCLATMHSLEDMDIDLKFGCKVAAVLTGVYAIFGLLPTQKDGKWQLGVSQYASKFWLTFLTAALGVILFILIVRFARKKVKFAPLLLAAVMSFSVFYSVIHISLGKFPQWDSDANLRAEMYDARKDINLPEDGFYRIDTFGSYDNLGLWLDKSCLQTFNSVVTPSIMEFYPMVGVKRDVSSKPEAKHYALRGLLNVQYTLIPSRKIDVPLDTLGKEPADFGLEEDAYTVPYSTLIEKMEYDPANLQMGWCSSVEHGSIGSNGWVFYAEMGPYIVFENQNFVPLGFTYNQYVDMDNLWMASEEDRAPILMRSLGLTKEQIEEYGALFEVEDGEYRLPQTEEDGQQASYHYDPPSYTEYEARCAEARQSASYETQADSSGFSVKIKMEKENLVFFGVPYDTGFTATVNGEETEVLQVSGGMMAVKAPAGDNEIVFAYRTPGMRAGILITLAGVLLLVAYLLLARKWDKKQAVLAAQKQEAEQREEDPSADDEVELLPYSPEGENDGDNSWRDRIEAEAPDAAELPESENDDTTESIE